MATQTKCYLKKGDIVKVITGDTRGKISEIIQVLRTKNQILVKGVNIKKKHIRPKRGRRMGQIVEFEAPIHSSNVMLYSEEKKVASRISVHIENSGKKIRLLKALTKQNKKI